MSSVALMSEPNFNVEGMNIIVTGGSKGLGWSLAQELSKAGASFILLIGGRSDSPVDGKEEWTTKEGCQMQYTKSNLASKDGVQEIMIKMRSTFANKRLDGLANVAGKSFPRATIEQIDFDLFDQMIALNCRAPIFLMKEAISIIKQQRSNKGGSIVNISSDAAFGGATDMFVYSLAKAALVNATKAAALNCQSYQIRINTVAMGQTATESELAFQSKSDQDWLSKADAQHPMGRLLRPIDIVASIGHLLSPASRMITGSVIPLCPEFIVGTLPPPHHQDDKDTSSNN